MKKETINTIATIISKVAGCTTELVIYKLLHTRISVNYTSKFISKIIAKIACGAIAYAAGNIVAEQINEEVSTLLSSIEEFKNEVKEEVEPINNNEDEQEIVIETCENLQAAENVARKYYSASGFIYKDSVSVFPANYIDEIPYGAIYWPASLIRHNLRIIKNGSKWEVMVPKPVIKCKDEGGII